MKHRLQTLLKHKLQWLALLTALLGVSQGVWSTDLYLRGSFNSWGTSSKFVDSKVIIYLGAATHEFKVGEGGDSNWKSYGVTNTDQNIMSCSVNSKTLTDSNDQNIKFTVSTASYYIFTFVLSTKELTIDCCNTSLSENVVSVLEGTKICFYAGVDNGWETKNVCLNDGTNNLITNASSYDYSNSGCLPSKSFKLAPIYLASGKYNISNSDISGNWKGALMPENAKEGKIYVLHNNGSNTVTDCTSNMSISTFKFDGSSGGSTKTVSIGETLTLYTECGTNTDPYSTSKNLEVQYYAKSAGGCYTLLGSGDVGDDNKNTKSGISVSDLDPGDYTLYALLTDKTNHRAYIKAGSTLSLTVTSCTYPGDLTVSANNTTSSLTVCSGADVVISATGYESGYSYTLYRGNTSLETKSCSSCSSLVFTKDNPTASSNTSVTYTIKAKQTDTSCEERSKGNKSVLIDAPSATGTIQGGGARCSTGSAKTLSLNNSKATQYQWYSSSSASGEYTLISEATGATYDASPGDNTYYKVEVKNGECGWTTGLSVSPALVSVDQPSVAGTILGDGAVCEGKGNLSVDGNRGSITWYHSDSESSGYSSTGTTASTYDATGITAKKYYKVYVKNGACDAVYSDPVLVSVGNIVKITVKEGGQISTAPNIYGWFNSDDKFLGNYPGTSTTGSGPYTLTADTKTCGTYNLIISDPSDKDNKKTNDVKGLTGDMCFTVTAWKSDPGNCCSGVSNPSMTTTGTSNLNVCADGENTFSVNVTSGGIGTLTYQWFKTSEATATGGSSVTEALPLSKGGNEYTLQHTDVGTYNYYCLVRSGDGCSEAVKSTSSLISNVTVKETPHLSPSSITVKPYEPVSITSTNSLVEWSVSKINGGSDADPDSDYYYIYDETKRNVKFKGNSENSVYKVVAEPESGSDCEGVTTITVEDDPDEGC